MSHDDQDPPRAHIEVLGSALLRVVARGVGAPRLPVVESAAHRLRELIASAVRTGEQVAGEVGRAAASAQRQLMADPVLGPWLSRIRTGVSLPEDLRDLFTDVLGRASTGETILPTDDDDPADAPADPDEEAAGPDADGRRARLALIPSADERALEAVAESAHASPETVAAISDALADGIRRAADRGGIVPAHSAEVTAWALTSLLMTLIMRSREGEDPDDLIEVAIAAIADLLGGEPPPAP